MIQKFLIGLNILMLVGILGLGYQVKKLRETNTKIHKFTAHIAMQFKKMEEMGKPKNTMLAIGEKVPSYLLKDAQSNEVSFPLTTNKKTLLVFSRPDCPYCEKYLPKVIKYAKDNKDKLNAVIIEQGKPDDIKGRTLGKESNTQLLVTDSEKFLTDLGIQYTPSTFLLDSNNVVMINGVFSSQEDLNKLDEFLL